MSNQIKNIRLFNFGRYEFYLPRNIPNSIVIFCY